MLKTKRSDNSLREAIDKVAHTPKQSSVIAFRETSLRSFYRNFATLVFPLDFSGNPCGDSNGLFLLKFLDTPNSQTKCNRVNYCRRYYYGSEVQAA